MGHGEEQEAVFQLLGNAMQVALINFVEALVAATPGAQVAPLQGSIPEYPFSGAQRDLMRQSRLFSCWR